MADIRITEASDTRVTESGDTRIVEVEGAVDAHRLTQKVVQVWADGATTVRETQKVVQVWYATFVRSHHTQKVVQAWVNQNTKVHLTQKVVQVWYIPCVSAGHVSGFGEGGTLPTIAAASAPVPCGGTPPVIGSVL